MIIVYMLVIYLFLNGKKNSTLCISLNYRLFNTSSSPLAQCGFGCIALPRNKSPYSCQVIYRQTVGAVVGRRGGCSSGHMCSVSPDSGVIPRSAPYNACLDCLCLALMGRCNTRHPSAALDHPLSAVTDRPAVRASRLLQSVGVYRRGWREARRLDLTNTLIFVFNRRGQKKR